MSSGIEPEIVESPERTDTVLLGVMGMGCVNCANRVHNALVRLPGVLSARVDLGAGAARIRYDPDRADLAAMLGAVAEAGRASGHRYAAVPVAYSSASS